MVSTNSQSQSASPARDGVSAADRTSEQGGNSPANGAGDAEHSSAPLARALGVASLGLGLTQIVAPRAVARFIGIDEHDRSRAILRTIGVRELASGIATDPRPEPGGWVGGNALDLALLFAAMGWPGADRKRVNAAMAAVLGITAADAISAARLAMRDGPTEESQAEPEDVPVTAAITVGAPLGQVFQAWEGFQNIPRFMGDFAEVEIHDTRTSRWSATLPAGMTLEWDVAITESTPNEVIAWRAGEGSPIDASGQIRFRPAPRDQGTEVLFSAAFRPPGGELGRKIGGLFAEGIATKIQNDLRRFKQLMELGEIVVSDDSAIKGPNPARPTSADAAA